MSSTLLQEADLPRAFATSPWQGQYRLQPTDFEVEEILGFEPEGQGEHLYLWIEKTGCNTAYIEQELARLAGVAPASVSCSGLKDRHAVTRQWFSIHLPGKADPVFPGVPDWRILQALRHPRKLKRGTHRANRFKLNIRLDRTTSETEAWLTTRWQQILQNGVPNYFGPQRFGHQGQNLQQGLDWLQGKNRRKPGRQLRSLWLSAVRSAIFNTRVAQLIQEEQWLHPLPGSCFTLQGTRSQFTGQPEEQTSLLERIQQGDLHPAAPLAGRGELRSLDQALLSESTFRGQQQDVWPLLEKHDLQLEYRPVRFLPQQAEMTWQAPWLQLAFTLPAGCFATSLLRELAQLQDAQAIVLE